MGKPRVDQQTPAPESPAHLLQEIAGFRTYSSRFHPDFDIDRLGAEVTGVIEIKDNDRRRIYCLQTATGGYYIKISTLNRYKDRLRHFLLPFRKWAEWRNLHRLSDAGIPAAIPVLKGEQKVWWAGAFFIMTAKVAGTALSSGSPAGAGKMGRYIARLHSRGICHQDLHPRNIILQPDNEPCLIDVQQVYFLPGLPRYWRVRSLGKLFYHFDRLAESGKWCDGFLSGYNQGQKNVLEMSEVLGAAERYRHRRYRSRSRRCRKNSSEFEIIKGRTLQGYKRRDFSCDAQDLKNALDKAIVVKPGRVFRFQDLCIKPHLRKWFHRDRCLNSWTMSRALAVRNVPVPAALGYFKMGDHSYFVSRFLDDSVRLNDYLSSLRDEAQKRAALKRLARWVKNIHGLGIRQHDFKSSNVLYHRGEFVLTDLDGVKIRPVSENHRITNLAQLNASLSNALSPKDRFRFYHYYTENEAVSRTRRRALYQKVWQITQNKNTKKSGLDLDRLCPQAQRHFRKVE